MWQIMNTSEAAKAEELAEEPSMLGRAHFQFKSESSYSALQI